MDEIKLENISTLKELKKTLNELSKKRPPVTYTDLPDRPALSAGTGNKSIVHDNRYNNNGYITEVTNTASGKGAIAIGYSTDAIGNNSFASGSGTTASGNASHSAGNGTEASGNYSHAEGSSSVASGAYAHAEGSQTNATGSYSHAEGHNCTASGTRSHAEGQNSVASGQASHAEGSKTHAVGTNSHAEGSNTWANGTNSFAAGEESIADGQASHAEGFKTQSHGNFSHTEGSNTHTYNRNSHAEGYGTTAGDEARGDKDANGSAININAHSEGAHTKATAENTHAEGDHTIAGYRNQTTTGQYNDNKEDSLFEIGNGNSTKRKNAFRVTKNGTAELEKQGDTDNSVVILSTLKNFSSGTQLYKHTITGTFIDAQTEVEFEFMANEAYLITNSGTPLTSDTIVWALLHDAIKINLNCYAHARGASYCFYNTFNPGGTVYIMAVDSFMNHEFFIAVGWNFTITDTVTKL